MKDKTLICKLRNNKRIKIYYKSQLIPISKLKIEKFKFLKACKACKNYNKNWACPPKVPDFYKYTKGADKMLLFLFYLKRSQIKKFKGKTKQEKLNSSYLFLKYKIEKLMYFLEELFKKNSKKFLTSGSCKLCYPKPCLREKGKKCKYPKKLRYSLEALGVNCITLSKEIFKKPLLWHEKTKPKKFEKFLGKQTPPKYLIVIAGLPLKASKSIKTPLTKPKPHPTQDKGKTKRKLREIIISKIK